MRTAPITVLNAAATVRRILEESTIEYMLRLTITHETIANHLGTHREVVAPLPRCSQKEWMVKLSRGIVERPAKVGWRR